MNLRLLIKENLLLEKRILQVLQDLQTQFYFEVSRTAHSDERKTRPELMDKDYNQREITNQELKEFVKLFFRDIAEHIVQHDIVNKKAFVIKSLKWELAMPIVPIHNGGTSWTLLFTSAFRESSDNPFRTGKDQLVIYK